MRRYPDRRAARGLRAAATSATGSPRTRRSVATSFASCAGTDRCGHATWRTASRTPGTRGGWNDDGAQRRDDARPDVEQRRGHDRRSRRAAAAVGSDGAEPPDGPNRASRSARWRARSSIASCAPVAWRTLAPVRLPRSTGVRRDGTARCRARARGRGRAGRGRGSDGRLVRARRAARPTRSAPDRAPVALRRSGQPTAITPRRCSTSSSAWRSTCRGRKRRWGYFVLPILHGDRLIGRIDPQFDRTTGVLRLPAVHAEPGTASLHGASVSRAFHELADGSARPRSTTAGPPGLAAGAHGLTQLDPAATRSACTDGPFAGRTVRTMSEPTPPPGPTPTAEPDDVGVDVRETLRERRQVPFRQRIREPDQYGLLLDPHLRADDRGRRVRRPGSSASRVVLLGVTLLFTMQHLARSRGSPGSWSPVPVLLIAAIFASAADSNGPHELTRGCVPLILAMLVAIARRLGTHLRSRGRCWPGLCIYLLVGP